MAFTPVCRDWESLDTAVTDPILKMMEVNPHPHPHPTCRIVQCQNEWYYQAVPLLSFHPSDTLWQ